MKKAILDVITFLGIQAAVSILVPFVWQLLTGTKDMSIAMLIITTVVFSVITIALFLWAGWAKVSPSWIRTRPWVVLAWSVVAALGFLIPSTWLQEQMPELPNIVEQEFDMILTNRWGYLTIGLLAPLAEEIVFRGAVLKSLLSSLQRPWVAIVISSFFFAVIHLNPAQMPHAFVVGLLLGWMYYRTGSILPGMAYHWANNSAAYIIYNMYPGSDIKLVDIFKGSETNVYLALVFSLLILLPALYQLHLWMHRADEQR